MTTPRPTAERVTSPPLPDVPGLPDWLPDEATLNRLAGEFFAALPGSPAGTLPGSLPGWLPAGAGRSDSFPTETGLPPGALPPTGSGLPAGSGLDAGPGFPASSGSPHPPAGEVDQAPRVDVPASATSVPQVPGETGSAGAGGVGARSGVPAADSSRPSPADPLAALGFSAGRSIPDVTEAAAGLLGSGGLGPLLPEEPLLPGVTGVLVAAPGDLTPALQAVAAPRPDAGAPGVPASDQLVGAGGLPNGPSDVTAAAPFGTGTALPVATPGATGPAPFSPAGGLAVPSAPGGELAPLEGLAAPLPSAGLPGLPASDQIVSGQGLPGGPPDVTAGSPFSPGFDGAAPTAAAPSTAGPSPFGAPPSVGPSPFAAPPAVGPSPFAASNGLSLPAVPAVPRVPGVRGADGLLPESVSTDVGTAAAARPPEPLFGDPDDTTVGAAAPAVGGPARSAAVHPEALPPPDYVGTPALPQPPVNMPELPAPVPTPSTPYYFIAESSPYRSAGEVPGLDTLAGAALDPAHVEPPAMNTVGGAIGAVPGAVTTGRPESGPWSGIDNPAAAPSPTSPAFYFADRAAPGNRSASDQISGLGRDAHPPFDVRLIRRDFPILSERVNGKPLVWLDNAATTQKPLAVLDRLTHFYRHENSNIHRAAHELAARATDAYEGARKTVARFIGAESEKEIVFVRGATEAINLVAKSWGKANIRRGDEIILSHLEHHANIVPWQQLIAETGARLRVIPVDDSGQILLDEYGKLLSSRTKLVAVTQVSNALGTVTPAASIVEMGHRAGACVLIDGAQSVPHLRVNLQSLRPDFFVFSGHKIFGPTGIGVVYGRQEVLESMPPWEGGGNMIADVTFEKTVYQHPPNRFEAGTGNIADAVGLGAALDYVTRIGPETIADYEHSLLEYATPRMRAVPGLRLIGTATNKASVLSFVLAGYRTEEVGAALNQEGIAVRSGHHCAQPILRRFGLETTVRPSLAFYNTTDEIDLLVRVLHRLAADRAR